MIPVWRRVELGATCALTLGAALTLTSACGDATTGGPGIQTPNASGSGTASAGANTLGGGGAAAGSTASAGQAGTTASAGAGGVGGMPAAGTENGGSGGSGGVAVGGGGSAGAAGGPAVDDSAALAPLNGFQLLDPCDLTSYKVEGSPSAVCPQLNDVKNQHVMRKLAGDANVTYDVTLRVRGIVERYWYEGGQLDAVSKVFYTGGVPTIGGFASACKNKVTELPFTLPPEVSPKDGCFNGFNVFAMTVSQPKQQYYLNYTTDKNGDRPPHAVYSQDYTVTIPLQGQATLDFYVIGSDEHQCYNHDQVIDGVKLASSPYIGEFLQFDVVSVKRAP